MGEPDGAVAIVTGGARGTRAAHVRGLVAEAAEVVPALGKIMPGRRSGVHPPEVVGRSRSPGGLSDVGGGIPSEP